MPLQNETPLIDKYLGHISISLDNGRIVITYGDIASLALTTHYGRLGYAQGRLRELEKRGMLARAMVEGERKIAAIEKILHAVDSTLNCPIWVMEGYLRPNFHLLHNWFVAGGERNGLNAEQIEQIKAIESNDTSEVVAMRAEFSALYEYLSIVAQDLPYNGGY